MSRMSEPLLDEDLENEKPRAGAAQNNRAPIIECICVSLLTGALYGYNTGIISGMSTKLITCGSEGLDLPKAAGDNAPLYESILCAEFIPGGLLGSLIGPIIVDKKSHKVALMVCGAFCLVPCTLMAVFDPYWVVVALRMAMGFSVGISCTAGPMYVSKNAPPAMAGRLGTVFQISICFFILVAEVVNYAVNPNDECFEHALSWKLQFGVGAVFGLLLLLYSIFAVKQYTVDPEPATDSDTSPSDEDEQQKGGWGALLSVQGFKYIFMATGLALCQQLTGINAIMFYGPKILGEAGFPQNEVLIMTFAVIGTWNLISVFVSFAFIDRLGRRPLMLGAMLAMFYCTLTAGFAHAAADVLPMMVRSGLSVAATMIYLLAFESGPGPLFFLMASEIFPDNVRTQGLTLCNVLAWIFNLAVVASFPILDSSFGAAVTQYIFAAISLIGFWFIYFFLPETKFMKKPDDEADAAD